MTSFSPVEAAMLAARVYAENYASAWYGRSQNGRRNLEGIVNASAALFVG